MPRSFLLIPSRLRIDRAESRRAFILENTGSETATDSIVRSMERYGSDPSIRQFEIAPVKNPLGARPSKEMSWTVRAVRYEADPAPRAGGYRS